MLFIVLRNHKQNLIEKMRFLSNYQVIIASLLFLLVLTNASCFSIKPIYLEKDKEIAQSNIEKFHQLFNDEKYNEMYDLFSAQIKSEISFDKFLESFKDLRTNTGKIKNSKLVKSEIKTEASFRVIELVYETEFENVTLSEKFSCLVDGNTSIIDIYDKPKPIFRN